MRSVYVLALLALPACTPPTLLRGPRAASDLALPTQRRLDVELCTGERLADVRLAAAIGSDSVLAIVGQRRDTLSLRTDVRRVTSYPPRSHAPVWVGLGVFSLGVAGAYGTDLCPGPPSNSEYGGDLENTACSLGNAALRTTMVALSMVSATVAGGITAGAVRQRPVHVYEYGCAAQ